MVSLQDKTPKNAAIEKLLSVRTVEQLGSLAESVSRAHARSVERRCIQYVEVVFNEKGFPRHIHVSDSVFMPAPGRAPVE